MHKLKKVYVEITNACNMSCSFCKKSKRPKMFISTDGFDYILKKIIPHTSSVYLHVLGEPLLHKELGTLLDICGQNQIKASITTNSTLIKEQKQNLINKPALRQINYSLHGIFESQYSPKDIIEDIYDLINSMGDNVYNCLRLWNFESSDEDRNGIIKDELRRVFGPDIAFPDGITQGNGAKIRDNIFIQQQKRFIWPSLNGMELFTKGRCQGLTHDAGILVDGSIVPCCLDGNGDIILGNIYEHSLEEALASERAVNIREGFSRNMVCEKLCRSCGFAMNNFS